ncbi:MAG: hypothetical protein WKF88_12540 [Ferruginibacter sp.]
MNGETILQSDILDIIFENRNKSYGAYTLRKFYHNRLYKAIALVCALVLLIVALNFLQKEVKTLTGIIVDTDTELKTPQKDPLPEKPKAPKPPKLPKPAATAGGPQRSLANVQVTVDHLADKRDSLLFGNETIAGKKGPLITGDPFPVTTAYIATASIPVVPAVTLPDQHTATDFAEVMPAYPGGREALRKFLERNLKTPQDAAEGETVSVKMKFVVGYDGVLKSFETIEDGGTAYNNEVIRVLQKMPKWLPGRSKGMNVSVFYTIPVKFTAVE